MKKKLFVLSLITIIVILTLILNCYDEDNYETPIQESTQNVDDPNKDLPPDKIYDKPIKYGTKKNDSEKNTSKNTTKSIPQTTTDIIKDVISEHQNLGFAYKTTRPLEIRLYIEKHHNLKPESTYYKASEEDNTTIVTITDNKTKDIVFEGASDDRGKIHTVITVASALDDCTLNIKQNGCLERNVVIEDFSKIQSLWREMYIAYDPNVYPILEDKDKDGVFDQSDKFPDDPSIAFVQKYPPNGNYAIAYEDLYPNLGDYDFNDFLAFYRVEQHMNASNQIVSMKVYSRAIARSAGYNHDFYIRIKQIDDANGTFTMKYYDENNNLVSEESSTAFQNNISLPIFIPTRKAFESAALNYSITNGKLNQPHFRGHLTEAEITFENPIETTNLAIAPYDPYIVVKNTGYDVHLIGETPIDNTKNPIEEHDFIDDNGYPWAMLVPIDWKHPLENVHMEIAYPQFKDWRESGGTTNLDWYNLHVDGKVYTITHSNPSGEISLDTGVVKIGETRYINRQLVVRMKEDYLPFPFTLKDPNDIVHTGVTELDALNMRYGASVIADYSHSLVSLIKNKDITEYVDQIGLSRVYILIFKSEVDLFEVKSEYEKLDCVEWSDVRELMELQTLDTRPNDPKLPLQRHLHEIKAEPAWSIIKTLPPTPVKIAIIDTGLVDENCSADLQFENLDENKAYLEPVILTENVSEPYGYKIEYTDTNDVSAVTAFGEGNRLHGSMVSGIAAAKHNNNLHYAGVCPNCPLYIMKMRPTAIDMLNLNAYFLFLSIENETKDVKVISLSMGVSDLAEPFTDYIKRPQVIATSNILFDMTNPNTELDGSPIDRNIVVVTAAGNKGNDTHYYPSYHPGVIGVGGTESGINPYSSTSYIYENEGLMYSSHFNDHVFKPANLVESYMHPRLSAPAVEIFFDATCGSSNLEQDSYYWGTGTSCATPMVAATVAMMYMIDPNLKPYNPTDPEDINTVMGILRKSFIPVPISGVPSFMIGGGALNTYNALLLTKTKDMSSLKDVNDTIETKNRHYNYHDDILTTETTITDKIELEWEVDPLANHYEIEYQLLKPFVNNFPDWAGVGVRMDYHCFEFPNCPPVGVHYVPTKKKCTAHNGDMTYPGGYFVAGPPAVVEEVPSNTMCFNVVENQEYYYRVRPIYNDLSSAKQYAGYWSDVDGFKVDILDDMIETANNCCFDIDGVTLSLTVNSNFSELITDVRIEGIDPNNSSYHHEFSDLNYSEYYVSNTYPDYLTQDWKSGRYQWSVTLTNDCDSKVYTRIVESFELQNPVIDELPQLICEGYGPITLNLEPGSGSEIVMFALHDGTSIVANASITGDVATIDTSTLPNSFTGSQYTWLVQRWNGLCSYFSNTKKLYITNAPQNPIHSSNNQCEGDIIAYLQFINYPPLLSGIDSVRLNSLPATIVGSQAEINISGWSAGTYTWEVDVTAAGCASTTFTETMEILPAPANPVDNVPDICKGSLAEIFFKPGTGASVTHVALGGLPATIIGDRAEVDISILPVGNCAWYVAYSDGTCSSEVNVPIEISEPPCAQGWIGSGSNGWKTTNGAIYGIDYQSFGYPSGIDIDTNGNLYIADYRLNRISKWDINGNSQGWIGGGSNGWKTIDGIPEGSDYQSFDGPLDVKIYNDHLYVVDYLNNRISKWDLNGNAQGWIGGGSNGWKTTNGANNGNDYRSFDEPFSIDIIFDEIYITEKRNHRINKWDINGNAQGWIGGGSNGWKTTNGANNGNDYQSFYEPFGISIDIIELNIYISDRGNDRISKWDINGNAQGWIGGGSNGWKTTNGANNGIDYQSFHKPAFLYVTPLFLYIVDTDDRRISRWDDQGNAYGWIGNNSNGWKIIDQDFSASPYNSFKSFYEPIGICYYNDYLYISDGGLARVNRWYGR